MNVKLFERLWWIALVAVVTALVLAVVMTPGCGVLRAVGLLPESPEPAKDVLADPFGYILGLLRTLLEWACILGIALLFPRPRAMLAPIISWMWSSPSPEPVLDAVLALPRAVGLVREGDHQRAAAKRRRAEKAADRAAKSGR